MQLSTRAKIALVLAVILIIGLVILFFINKKNQSTLEPTQSSTTDNIFAPSTIADNGSPIGAQAGESADSIDQILGASPTSTASGVTASSSASVLAKPSTSPTKSTTRVALTPTSSVDVNGVRTYKINVTPAPNAGPLDWTVTEKEIIVVDSTSSPYNNYSLCKLAGLSNSWSNSIEKIACDSVNFLNDKLLEPMGQLACAFHASELQANYKSTISYEYKGGACLIIDR